MAQPPPTPCMTTSKPWPPPLPESHWVSSYVPASPQLAGLLPLASALHWKAQTSMSEVHLDPLEEI